MQPEDEFGLNDDQEQEGTETDAEANKERWRDEFFKLQKKYQRDIEKTKASTRDEVLAEMGKKKAAEDLAATLGNPKAADLFLRVNPEAEVSEDSMKEFFTNYGFELKQQEEAEKKEPAPQVATQTGTTGNAASTTFHQNVDSVTPANKKYTARELYKEYQAGIIDIVEFNRRIAEGQMQR